LELWSRLAAFLLRLIEDYDDQAIFLLMFLEESGVPLPLPGDVYMVLAGYRVAQGEMSLLWALLLIQTATTLGAMLLYWLAARGGRPLLYRFGRFVRLDAAKLDRAEGWMRRRAALAIFFGRIIPGLRTPTVIAAGVFGVPLVKFLPAFTAGSFLYILFFVLLGMWLGPRALGSLDGVRLSARALVTLAAFVGLGALLVVLYRRAAPIRRLPLQPAPEARKLETTALAALLATVQMGLGVNVLLYALSALGRMMPERALIHLLQEGAARYADGNVVRFLALVLVVLLVLDFGWAVLYTHVAVEALAMPPWLRGLAFSILPLAVSTLVLMPLLGAGPLGLGLNAGFVPFAGEVLRNALFGVGLAASYSLLRAARQAPAAAPGPR
jgi:membrane protein DedA with SNARE-associated domain